MFSGAESRLREALSADEAEHWRRQLHGLGLKVMIDPPPLIRPPVKAGPDAEGLPPRLGARRTAHAAARQPPVFGLDFQGRLEREAYLKGRLLHLHRGRRRLAPASQSAPSRRGCGGCTPSSASMTGRLP